MYPGVRQRDCPKDVLADDGVIHILHAHAIAAGAAIARNRVVLDSDTATVHEKCAHRIVQQRVVFNRRIVTIHEVQPVATVTDFVVAHRDAFEYHRTTSRPFVISLPSISTSWLYQMRIGSPRRAGRGLCS